MTRLRQVQCSDVLLRDFLTQGFDGRLRCLEGLPEGAKPAGVIVPIPHQSFIVGLLYEHESFEDVAPGEPIPVLRVEFGRIYEENDATDR